jgi:branched-chain amino acid transport system substrate-binding protein
VWVKGVNARGGVNGHRVVQIMADDGGDPARHRALTRQMVERDKVAAFVYKAEVLGGFSTPDPYIVEHRIPVIGVDLGEDYVYDSPFYFPQGASGDVLAMSNVAAWASAVSPTERRIGTLVCAESPSCSRIGGVWGKTAESYGLQPVYQGRASLAQPDYTAECFAARNAGVQLFAVALDDKSLARLARSCDRQSFKPRYLFVATNALQAAASEPSLQGGIVGSPVFAWPAADNPARKEFIDAFARIMPEAAVNGMHSYGWVAAKLFERATQDLSDPPTNEAVLKGLWSIRNDDLGGLTYPMSFAPDRNPERKVCWSVVVVANHRFTAPSGGGLACK